MANVIILRLTPATPTSGAEFTNYLRNLDIKAFDVGFADSRTGVLVGRASGLLAPLGKAKIDLVDPKAPRIIQHFTLIQKIAKPEAVATAVIVVSPPAGHKEFSGPDIRLEITNGGLSLLNQKIDFNVATVSSTSAVPADYVALPAGLYFSVPDPALGLSPTVAHVTLPADGTPPRYSELLHAVDLVLAQDPGPPNGTLTQLSPLTPAQARLIAHEIAWNRTLAPFPAPPLRLEDLYTRPPTNPATVDIAAADQARKQFEAERDGYYSMQDIRADRLTNYVFAISAAAWAEQRSKAAVLGRLQFPVDPEAAPDSVTIKKAEVALIPPGGTAAALGFGIPAPFFYALGATMAPSVDALQRFKSATLYEEEQTIADIERAIDAGIIDPQPITPAQAARRLNALGVRTDTGLPQCPVEGDVVPLLNAWLAFPDTDIDVFWAANIHTFPAGHVDLVLSALTKQQAPLIAALRALPIGNVDALKALNTADWTRFFLPSHADLLPDFTKPGTPEERVAAFIRQLRRFFPVGGVSTATPAIASAPAPGFGIAVDDPIAAFVNAYNAIHPTPPLLFGTPIDQAAYHQALQQVFPDDAEARAWLDQLLLAIDELVHMTQGIDAKLQFSLIEALYARGFTSRADVQLLSFPEFQEALTGTVAYAHAQKIYANAGGTGGAGHGPTGPFTPVNPDGSLINCIPPWHLSPFGPVAYLHELLKASDRTTCDEPAPDVDGQRTLGVVIAGRRGPLGDLHAAAANLDTALPAIDLVNESLEALASGSAAGAVYDTNAVELNGHRLRPPGSTADRYDDSRPYEHDPVVMFAAIPEHSTPACPVGRPHGYELLRSDFSSPLLPYSQPLDVSRSYLRQLGTSRFSAMRRFRKDITEFVLDPSLEPADFQRHLWRYPVRLSIAIEYLGISPEEYGLLYTESTASPSAAALYGFLPGDQAWTTTVLDVPEFLTRTGLSYCEFLELWQSRYVPFSAAGTERGFPDCEPCCPENLRIRFDTEDSSGVLHRLAVFIRLWRTLQGVAGAKYSFRELCDICLVLELFLPNGSVNPDFIRQLAAFQMLRDDFNLALGVRRNAPSGATGADRTALLALWAGPNSANWSWALEHLLDGIEDVAEQRHDCEREAELMKVIAANLDPLSSLAGFDPAGSATWHAHPASTLRFAEVLLKIYLSDFTVGELLFLFTVDPHLDGDDPFPQEDDNESLDLPLDLPEDADAYSLWELRRKLRGLQVEEEACRKWTWQHIVNSLRDEFGYVSSGGPDRLQSLGEHFFPEVLARHGYGAPPSNRRYSTPLAGSNAAMWNTPPDGPFHYDAAAQELSIALPLRDEAVVGKLNHVRQLTQAEQDAVAQLYFSPRADLAPFAMIFENFTEAENILIEEEDERKRWHYFRNAFARFHARCSIIAGHLAEHVSAASDGECMEEGLAWKVLRSLLADENRGTTPWEDDSGQPPAAHWWPQPGGGAFAALLGLTGTGLFGEIASESGAPIWNEVRGPMRAFGFHRNKSGAPFPTVLPSMGFTLPPDQLQFAVLRNGFAIRDTDGAPLGGAEGFRARWSGVLLVEKAGSYEFFAGMPTEHGLEPDCEDVEHQRWRVTLQRGQRTWVLLNRRWPGEDAPDAHSAPVSLKRGAYSIAIDFAQRPREFDESHDARRGHAGFEVKYKGPDSNDELTPLPLDHLFRDVNDATLAAVPKVVPAAHDFLAGHFSSSLRGIRRTYIRAFEALLFAHRFDLSARLMVGHSQSEIGFLLAHPANFLGTSYYPAAGPAFHTHHTYFDFNLLPVRDDYHPPAAADDERVRPSLRRRQALFDWWERIYDYTVMRRESRRGRERPVWLLFLESAENQPDLPGLLVRHLGVDIRHAPLLLRYDPAYDVTSGNLEDERWALRVWHGETWIRALVQHFVPRDFNGWRPDLWASDDPGAIAPGETKSGNANLTGVVQDGSLENGEPRRYVDVQHVNDGLRERGRAALLAYLCGMNRVPLPWAANAFAKTPQDLSDLLLQDVQVGLSETTSRIEEAVSVVQTFVERARLGLEPGFVITTAFVYAWDRLFATFHVWQACRRRRIYRETYVEWDELEKARRTEAFRFLESELRRSALTFPLPGGKEYWPGNRPAPHPSIELLQNREPSHLNIVPQPEMLGLMGTPERDARPTWLAPMSKGQQGVGTPGSSNMPSTTAADTQGLPLWIQAAIRLGVRFLRIAAAGDPPASAGFTAHGRNKSPCCSCCGRAHEPVVDEYYFWLVDAKFYEAQAQDATWGTTPSDPTPDWERDNKLPGLLRWPAQPMVRLYWCRVHNGEFQAARRSDDGVHVQSAGSPQLVFLGRTGDSLQFSVTDAAPLPAGFSDPSPWGFRYDMAPDTAVVLPEVVATPLAPPSAGGLSAYPYFSYYEPGAPIEPSSWFTPALTIAGTLRAHCRFEAALKWYEVHYKPLDSDNHWSRCEHQPGLVDPAGRQLPDNPCCPTESASDELVHQRSVLLHYLETLAQFGDAAMCCANSPEGFHKARLIFDTMARILGPHPQTIPSADEGSDPQTVALFVPRFAPLNPRLLALYDLVTERLSLIHHNLNKCRLRNGTLHTDMPFWGNSPVRTAATGACNPEDDCCCPRSPYRFLFVLPKALEVSGDVRALGSELLSAYEKGDAELLAQLRVTHERQLLNRTLEVRENEWRSADWELQALKKAKEGALARLQYYSDLIANGLISKEQAYETLTNASMITRAGGNTIEAITQVNHLVPDPTTGAIGPLPVAIFGLPVGSKVANSLSAAARILYAVADITGTLASLRLTQAGWDRRLQEWQQQVIVITIEIEQIQRQILGAERRRDAALRSLNNQRLQMEQSAEVQDFLRDKFTSHALYLHLQQETAALHRRMYDLALCWAQQAQRAFNFERGHTTRKFLPEPGWDGLHEGLLSGERLQLALRQMEKSFLDLNTREYELAKHVSLRTDFALELLRLKATGSCEIDIPEWMFDLDYPGQYMRRIKNVSISIPCVSGPYTGVHCRLTLLSSRTRIETSLLHANHCCPDCTPADGYAALPDDPRIVCHYSALEALATSTGVNDTGMFELNFRDERYLPFEYAGAVSRWRIELPHENNRFDVDSVTDVVLHVSYMAREGGDVLRQAAGDAAQRHLTTDGIRYFDVASDFSDAWQIFQSQAGDEDCDDTLALRLRRAMFPFLPGERPVEIRRIDLFFEASCPRPGNSHVVEFLPNHRHGEDECCCEVRQITCVASAEWPCLFHGVIDVEIPLEQHRHSDIGAFRFPNCAGEIRRAYLICGYQAFGMERCEPFHLPLLPMCSEKNREARGVVTITASK